MLSNNCSILLIDDDADVLDAYTQLLEQAGYHVSACNNPFDAREQVPKDWPGIVLSDVCMPGCSGIDLMTLFHQDDDLLPILLITGHGDVPMAVEAVKKGAWDFLQKPIDPGKLLTLVDAALRQRQSVIARRQYCQQKLQVELIGRSQWTVRYRQRLQQLAETDIAVWLYGEPGTGRMTGARYLHQLGRHAEGPFIACELTPANSSKARGCPRKFESSDRCGKTVARTYLFGQRRRTSQFSYYNMSAHNVYYVKSPIEGIYATYRIHSSVSLLFT
ncbi:transcriptional regulator [Klebsiella pneumoniae]|nr:transcriptional regulator [Klebsiella pneumoniae]